MTTDGDRKSPLEAPLGQLERELIDGFLRARGYDPDHLGGLTAEQQRTLLRDASLYASAKLTEIESRLRFLQEIHARIPGGAKTGLE